MALFMLHVLFEKLCAINRNKTQNWILLVDTTNSRELKTRIISLDIQYPPLYQIFTDIVRFHGGVTEVGALISGI